MAEARKIRAAKIVMACCIQSVCRTIPHQRRYTVLKYITIKSQRRIRRIRNQAARKIQVTTATPAEYYWCSCVFLSLKLRMLRLLLLCLNWILKRRNVGTCTAVIAEWDSFNRKSACRQSRSSAWSVHCTLYSTRSGVCVLAQVRRHWVLKEIRPYHEAVNLLIKIQRGRMVSTTLAIRPL